jgi:FkbM family methyltransferase
VQAPSRACAQFRSTIFAVIGRNAVPRRIRHAVRPMVDRIAGPLDVPRRFRPIFRDLRAGELAVDCGAHVGRITAVLAARGVVVHAFEPNPHAFAILAARFEGAENVHCHEQAVSTDAGRAQLHLHVLADEDPVGRAVGSSLLTSKRNVSNERFVEVETVDLAAFLAGLERPAALLKLDVEGVELAILERLAHNGLLEQIRHVLVEMHDRSSAGGFVPAGRAVRSLLAEPRFAHVRLDWD